MVYDIPTDLPPEIVPLSWLLGVWEGSGILDYTVNGEKVTREFGHRISFSHDGLQHLNYSSYTWLEPDAAQTDAADDAVPAPPVPLMTETGY